MTAKNAPDQSPLFEGGSLKRGYNDRNTTTWQDVEGAQPLYPTAYGPEGSYVNVAERAALLITSLDALSRRNQRLGFDTAAHTRPNRRKIEARYGEATQFVVEGAQRREQEFLNQARHSFWEATGFAAMRGFTHMGDEGMDHEDIDARAKQMWLVFSRRYGDPEKRQMRDKYKRQLHKAIKDQRQKAA